MFPQFWAESTLPLPMNEDVINAHSYIPVHFYSRVNLPMHSWDNPSATVSLILSDRLFSWLKGGHCCGDVMQMYTSTTSKYLPPNIKWTTLLQCKQCKQANVGKEGLSSKGLWFCFLNVALTLVCIDSTWHTLICKSVTQRIITTFSFLQHFLKCLKKNQNEKNFRIANWYPGLLWLTSRGKIATSNEGCIVLAQNLQNVFALLMLALLEKPDNRHMSKAKQNFLFSHDWAEVGLWLWLHVRSVSGSRPHHYR